MLEFKGRNETYHLVIRDCEFYSESYADHLPRDPVVYYRELRGKVESTYFSKWAKTFV